VPWERCPPVTTSTGLILYGPPAVGKDSITAALTRLDPRYELLRRLKVGSGRHDGYEVCSADELERMAEAGEVLYRNSRYGNEYAVGLPSLWAAVGRDVVPVAHLGQLAGITALRRYPLIRWHTVLLWCAEDVTVCRSEHRGDPDVRHRLAAWQETRADLARQPSFAFDLVVRTDVRPVERSAVLVHRSVDSL
jgi:guanylate kinase